MNRLISSLRHSLLAAALALPLTAFAQTVDLAGIKYPPTATAGSSTLLLNGAGIRYRFVVKVYTAGLTSVRLKVEQNQLVIEDGWFRSGAIRLQGA